MYLEKGSDVLGLLYTLTVAGLEQQMVLTVSPPE